MQTMKPRDNQHNSRQAFSNVATVLGSWPDATALAADLSPTQGRGDNTPAKATAITPRPSPEERGELAFPPLSTQVASFLGAVVAFVGDGCVLVNDTEHRRRLDVCRTCDRRAGRRCAACGCWIAMKARGRAFSCPLGRWEDAGDKMVAMGRKRDDSSNETP